MAQLREFAPGHPVIFTLYHGGFIEFIGMRLFLRKRFSSEFELNEAFGISNFLLDFFSGRARRVASALGFAKLPQSRAKLCSDELAKGNPVFMNFKLREDNSALVAPESEKILDLLVEKHPKLLIVPVVFVWRRAGRFKDDGPKDFQTRLMKFLAAPIAMPWYFLLGDPYSPRGLRKLLLMLRGYTRSMLRLADVIECDGQEARSLRRQSYLSIQQEKKILLGPAYKSTSALQEQILRHPKFQLFVQNLAIENGLHEKNLLDRSVSLFREMAAKYSFFVTEVSGWVLEKVFNTVYKGVSYNKEEIEALREDMRGGAVVLVPNHRSYFDFLLMSYILFKEGVMTPHVIAGINLNFWPIGAILKRGGGIFIRRRFRGDKLYSEILRRYVVQLLNNRLPLEFFIEGTRSRNGKLAPPKFGILKMIFDSFLSKELDQELRIVPISITYDKVTEEGAHSRELAGGEKKKESVLNLVKSGNFIFRNYGKVHLRFAPSIHVKDWSETLSKTPTGEIDNRYGVQKLAFEVCHRINQSIPLTAQGIVCFLFMLKPGNALSDREYGTLIKKVKEDAKHLGLGLSTELEKDFERACDKAFASLLAEKTLRRYDTVDDVAAHRIAEKSRIHALYYKNNVVHAFVTAAMVYLSDKKREEFMSLRKLLEFEYFFPEKESHWATAEAMDSRVCSPLFAHALDNTLETIELGMRTLLNEANLILSEKEWTPRMMKFGRQKISEGEVKRMEAVNTQGFGAFVSLAKVEGWLAEAGELNDRKFRVNNSEEISQRLEKLKAFRSKIPSWEDVLSDISS